MALWQWWLPATSTVQWFPPKRCGPGDRSAVPQGARNHTGVGRVSKGMEHQMGQWGRCTNKNKLGAENFNHGSWGFFIGCDIFHPKCGIWICIKMAEFTIILCRLNMGKTRFLTLNPEMEWSLKDIEPQQSVGTHGVGVYPILVVCWAWYLAQECPRCWICQSVGDKSHTGFGVLWGSSNEDQQKQPNEGRKRTDTPHSYCLHIGPTPVPAFPMTRCSPTPSHSKADIAEEKHQSSVAQRRQMEERFWKGLQSILSLVHLGLIFSPKMAILCNSYRESHDTASKFLGYPILRQIHLRKTNYTFNCFHKPRSLRRFTAPETEKSSWRARNDRFARRWRSGVAWFLIPFWLLSCPIFLRVKNVFFFNAEIPMFAGQPPLSFCEKYVDHWWQPSWLQLTEMQGGQAADSGGDGRGWAKHSAQNGGYHHFMAIFIRNIVIHHRIFG